MDPRRFCSLLFLLTLPLVAQTQDPDRPAPSQADELAALQREKERLLSEIDYVKSRVANAKDLLAGKFAQRKLTVRAIDAGTSSITMPAAPPRAPRHARLMQADEASNYPPDVMMLVSGSPISRALYEQLVALPGANANMDPDIRGQIALYELIRIEGTAGEFTENDLEGPTQELMEKLAAGKTIPQLVADYGTLAGAEADGRIEVTRNSRFGPRLEQVLFGLEDGANSRPFRHHAGIVVLHRDSVEKGTTPELDKVIAHAVQIPYTHDPALLQKAVAAVSGAQIEIVVRDKETMMLLPFVFRDAEYMPKPTPPGPDEVANVDVMMKTLENLQQEIERAQNSDSDVEKGRVPMLEARYERLKAELSARTHGQKPQDEKPQEEKPQDPKPQGEKGGAKKDTNG